MLKPTTENTQHNLNELFDTLKELSVKNKTLLTQEEELTKDIFTKQVLSVLHNALNKFNEQSTHAVNFEYYLHFIKTGVPCDVIVNTPKAISPFLVPPPNVSKAPLV